MSAVSAPPASPFKGLAAFADSELDALFFFGREREREVLVANLLAARLTVLYGESGVGKSSLLAAAVVRDLRHAVGDAPVVLHGSWSGPIDGLLDDLRHVGEGYVILDQFEEYFLYHADEDGPGSLLHDLPELLRDGRVNVLIAIREDALARLDVFKARIPAVFANQVRLEHLEPAQARSAILGPLERWNELTGEHVNAEPALIDELLDQTRTAERDRIEAPYLQLVLERVWQAEREEGSTLLRRETLRHLGGAATIVRDHLHVALDSLDADEQDVAADMFEHLVTPSGTKIAHRAPDLADYARVPEPMLRRVLAALTRDRIVHSVDGSDRYEIFHDVLAEPISAWRLQRQLEQERRASRVRQRRLLGVVAAALVALAFVGALAVWAFSERGTARSQAEQARARELDALALQALQNNPNRGVSLALTAARLRSDHGTESVLRQALVADRLLLAAHVKAPIHAVAVSRDGKLIAVAAGPRTVLLLSGVNRRTLRRLKAPGLVGELAFSPDGRTVTVGSAFGVARTWDVQSGALQPAGGVMARIPNGGYRIVRLRGGLRAKLAHVRRLVTTKDGSHIAAIVTEKGGKVNAFLYAADGTFIRRLPIAGVRDLSYSPDGTVLATAAANADTMLWNAATGRFEHTFTDAKRGSNALAFSPDGTFLATGGRDDAVRIWTVAPGKTFGERTFFLFQHKGPIESLAWSPDSRVVASGSDDDTTVLWRIQNQVGVGSLAAILAGGTAPVTALAFAPDDSRLVTGGADSVVRVWDGRPDQQLALLSRARGAAIGARWAGTRIVALWSSGTLETFDARTHRRVVSFVEPSRERATALGVSSDGGVIAVGTAVGSTVAWHAPGRAPTWSSSGTAPVTALAVAPSGDAVATGDMAGSLKLLRGATGDQLWTKGLGGRVWSIAFSPSGDSVAVADARGVVVVTRDGTVHPLVRSTAARVVRISPDGRYIAAGGVDGALRIWFAKSLALYRVLHGSTRPLDDLAFSADSALVATAGSDAQAHVWSVGSGTGHRLQRAVAGPLAAIGLDASGRWAVGAGPASAVLWNALDGSLLAYLRGHGPLLTTASFSPSGPTVLTSSTDGTVRTYDCETCVDLPTLVHLAEHRLAQTR